MLVTTSTDALTSETEALGEDVARRIEAQILDGTLKPGDRLPQGQIAEHLGISRTPVREGLLILQSRGLVTFVRNRGAMVRRVTRRECVETYLVRAELEGLAAELAAGLITPRELDELQAASDAFAKWGQRLLGGHAARGGSHDSRTQDAWIGYFEANDAFHDLIAKASHCGRLVDTLKYLLSLLPRAVTVLTVESGAIAIRAYHDDHIAMIEALAAHDKERARRAASKHVIRARDLMLNWIETMDEGIDY